MLPYMVVALICSGISYLVTNGIQSSVLYIITNAIITGGLYILLCRIIKLEMSEEVENWFSNLKKKRK
jgi:hypothetical protein